MERRLTVQVNPVVGEFILENRKERLKRVRRSTRVWLDVELDSSIPVDEYRIFSRKQKVDITDQLKT